MCDQLSEGMQSVGENIFQTGELINSHLGSKHMKYHIYETETLLELFKLRDEYLALFLQKEKELLKKKEKLFLQTQDFAQWKCTHTSPEQMEPHRMELLADKEKAFKFMLSEESAQLDEMRSELSFYEN